MNLLDKIKNLKPDAFYIVMACLFLTGFSVILLESLYVTPNQHYVYLAESFLQGKLHFVQPISKIKWLDTCLYKGNIYWPLGLFPAVVLMPFVALLGPLPLQASAGIFLTLIGMAFMCSVFYKITNDTKSAILLTFFYVFGSVYHFIIQHPESWFFAHIVNTTFMFGTLYFTIVKNRPIIAGILFSCTFLSRISSALGIGFFFFYYYFFNKKTFVKDLSKFLIAVTVGVLVFFTYNYARFDNIFDTGYKHQIGVQELSRGRDRFGMWGIVHFPTNIYRLFFRGLDSIKYPETYTIQHYKVSKEGLSIFITTPVIIYLAFTKLKKKITISSLVAIVPILLFVLGSFGYGGIQYGYRFTLDFQPYLFLILATIIKVDVVSVLLAMYSFVFYFLIW